MEKSPEMKMMSLYRLGLEFEKKYEELKAEYDKELAKKRKGISEFREELRRRIEAGETTGDALADKVLIYHGFDEGILNAYRNFELQLKGKKGQLILIEYWVEERGIRGEDSIQGRIQISILEDDSLSYHRHTLKGLSLPLKQAFQYDRFGIEETIESDVAAKRTNRAEDLPNLAEHVLRGVLEVPGWYSPKSAYTGFFIGDEAVKGWLRKSVTQPAKVYSNLTILLRKLELEPMGKNEGPLPHKEESPAAKEDPFFHVKDGFFEANIKKP